MTPDISSLQIRVLYDSIDKAESRLDQLEKTGRKTEKGVSDLGKKSDSVFGKFAGYATGIGAVTTAIAGMRAVINTTREFQVMRASVESSTGSVANMEKAWTSLVRFASTTPYTLDQAVNGFTKLVNLGLTPSERALTSYGETASAMGKDLTQMIEAVADASTGEFERLKEFGIKASKQDDEVAFTFRNVTKTVAFSAKEIEKYLMELGENNFAGSMAKRMETLDGAISNLEDTWEQLKFAVGQAGFGEVAEDGIRGITSALEDLRRMIASGELGMYFDNFFGQIKDGTKSVRDELAEGFSLMSTDIEKFVGTSEISADEWADYWKEVFNNLPASITYFVKRAGVELGTFVNIAAEIASDAAEHFVANFTAGVEKIQALMQEVASYAPGAAAFDLDAAYAGIDKKFNDTVNGIQTEARIESMWDDRKAEIEQLERELQDQFDRSDAIGLEARRKRWEYEQSLNPINGPYLPGEGAPDELGSLLPPIGAVGNGSTSGGSGGSKKKKKGGGRGGMSEFERLAQSLQDEENLIADSYDRRIALIEANTREGSKIQADLELSLTDKFEEEQMKRIELLKKEPETMFQAFAEEEALIEASYERRKQIILEATELTEDEKLKLLKEAELKHTQEMRKHEIERNKMAADLAADFFGNIAEIAGAFGKKGAKIAKAAAIVQTTIKTYEAATSAYASLAGIPYIGPALGAAAAAAAIAAGVANVQKIRSQDENSAGAYATGGIVPGSSYTGDQLTARVNSKEMILTQAQQRNLFEIANGKETGGAGGPTINIFNQAPGVTVETRQRQGPDGKQVDFIIKAITAQIDAGGNDLAAALENRYQLRRA